MKIRFAKKTATIFALILFSKTSFSQTEAVPDFSTLKVPVIYNEDPTDGSQVKINSIEVSRKALKSFKDYFSDVANVTWWRQGIQYMAEFRKDGKWVKAYFTGKGKFISSFAITTEEYLPDDIQSDINKIYKHYKITVATEVFLNNTNTALWFVNLENEMRMMQVRITDGQMEEVFDRKKSE